MMRLFIPIPAILLLYIFFPASFAHAASADRIAVEARVRAEVSKDLALPLRPGEGLAGRDCLDGRPVKDFSGDIAQYWVNLEWCAV
jgi:hypothetical protein